MNLLEEAIIYSTILHQGKTRKFSGKPYILHPLEVSQILSELTDDMEVIAAGVLHDIVEDTDGTLGEIRKRFGDRVAMLVDAETEQDFPGEDRAATWQKRKQQSLDVLRRSTDIGVKMLWLADKLANLRSLAHSYGEMGEKLWEHLHQKDPGIQLWYYRTIAEYIEMDLNKTGAYKEYIDRINYIWPGTFDTAKTKYRKYREIDVSGCACIGRGAKAEVCRYDDELIVKVYNEKNTYKDVEREIALARTAFVMGLPTAISFGIVSVGNRYGAMFELIDARTLSELIAGNPEHADYYAGIMAALARQIHSTEPADASLFPDAALQMEGWVKRAQLDAALEEKLLERLRAMKPVKTLVHGDFHTGNVFLSGGEPLFIDVDRMAIGDPILDLSSLYLFYVGYAELDPAIIEDFMGFSAQTAQTFYQCFLARYLADAGDAERVQTEQAAQLWAYVRLIGQMRRKPDSDAAAAARLTERIRALVS